MRRIQRVGLLLPLLVFTACTREEAPAVPAEAPAEREAPPEEEAPAAPAEAPGESAAEPAAGAAAEPAAPDEHTSRNALDWAGTYSGVLPCASCPGIETVITLRDDGTFERSLLYIDEAPLPEMQSGTFTWDDDGNTVTLDTGAGETQQYQVGENVLTQLDRDGARITGDLADQYALNKHVRDPAVEDKRWKLVELRGTPVDAGQAGRPAVLTLSAGDSVASGNTSCNSFSGTYAIKSGQRLSFGRNMAVTMMACPDMAIESAFLEVLQQADSYSLGEDGTLSLNRARMAPLARFVIGDD